MDPFELAALNAQLQAQNDYIDARGRGGFNPAPPAMNMTGVGQIDPFTGEKIEMFDAPSPSYDMQPNYGFNPGAGYQGGYDTPSYSTPPMSYGGVPSSEDKASMTDILMRFRDAGGMQMVTEMNRLTSGLNQTANNVINDSYDMPELRQALRTSKTENGVRVGSWEITIPRSGSKRYDVSHVDTGEPLAKNLYLYEAAEALVKHLNEGHGINHKKIHHILALEMDFARAMDDAIHHKHQLSRAEERGDDHKLDIAEARLSEAKLQATKAKRALLEYLKS